MSIVIGISHKNRLFSGTCFTSLDLVKNFVEAEPDRTVYKSINQSSLVAIFSLCYGLISDLSKGYAKAVEDLSKIG